MQKITPHLWFDTQAREAAEFYADVFPKSKITNVITIQGTPSGDCDIVSFDLAGQPFLAISAGPLFKFNPSVSFQINCNTEIEVDAIWEQLSSGGKVLMPLGAYPFSERFGWLEDKYGLSWQVMYAEGIAGQQKLTPVLMFTGNVCGKAEEALGFYVSVFENAPNAAKGHDTKAEILARYGKDSQPDQEGTVQYAHFSLVGQEFGAMDSARAHSFSFNEAVSFVVPCDTQEEIDYFWEKLSADRTAEQCGWLKDKYGLSWQVTPAGMQELLGGSDKERIRRVTQAVLKMKKFDIAALERAVAGRGAVSAS